MMECGVENGVTELKSVPTKEYPSLKLIGGKLLMKPPPQCGINRNPITMMSATLIQSESILQVMKSIQSYE